MIAGREKGISLRFFDSPARTGPVRLYDSSAPMETIRTTTELRIWRGVQEEVVRACVPSVGLGLTRPWILNALKASTFNLRGPPASGTPILRGCGANPFRYSLSPAIIRKRGLSMKRTFLFAAMSVAALI